MPRATDSTAGSPATTPHLLPAEPADPIPGRTVVEVESTEALARVAERYERFILHSETGGGHTFLVDDGATLYRYVTGGPLPADQEPADREPAAADDPGPAPNAFEAFLRPTGR